MTDFHSGSLRLAEERHPYRFKADSTARQDHIRVSIIQKINGKFSDLCYVCVLTRQSGKDVLDGLKQQPHIRSTIQDFQFNYGLPQDKPQHVLVIAEKGTRVPDVISSIPYYIPQPPDGKWEMDLTILKSDKDLSGIEPTKGLNHKEVTADSWTELPSHRIALPFDNSIENFGVSSVDTDEKPVINGCVYILIELRGIQFVIYAIGRLNGKEDAGLRNSRTTKRLGYGVDEFGDTSKYFHVIASNPPWNSSWKSSGTDRYVWKRRVPLKRIHVLT